MNIELYIQFRKQEQGIMKGSRAALKPWHLRLPFSIIYEYI